ncbi:MAG: Rab family GTPase [Candidatus Odinarchaeota archaeon]
MSSYKLKVLLTGAETVCKPSLIQKLIKNRFRSNYKLTVGVDILTKDVEFQQGEIATLSIWDIGELQRFEFIRSTFYKGAAGALFVFDLGQKTTFIKVKELFAEIKKFVGSIPFVLIGKNIHLNKLVEKTINRKMAREFARNEGGLYIETSPTDIDIIEETVRNFTRRIINSRNI